MDNILLRLSRWGTIGLLASSLSLPVVGAEPILTDDQAKQVRETSQAILRSRLIQKEQQQASLIAVRQQLASLQSIANDIEREMVNERMTAQINYQPAHQVNVGTLVVAPNTTSIFHYDPATNTVTEHKKTIPAPVTTAAIPTAQSLTTATAQGKRQAMIQSTRQSLDNLKSGLQTSASSTQPSLLSRIQRVLGLADTNATANTDARLNSVPQTALLTLTDEADAILQAFENNEADAYARIKALKARVQLQTPSSQLPEVDPTIANRTKHKTP